ncbi:MAG: hypothetical protein JXX28_03815 [Deltaproteobacteria bacterium]|nr:hypothetical protein [Deltaproteobacteria bacterium]
MLFFLSLQALAASLGDPVDEAVAVHLTQGGLAAVGDVVEALLPPRFEVSALEGTFACAEADENPLSYQLDPLTLLLEVQDVQLVAAEGQLSLALYATLGSTGSTLTARGDCSVLTGLDEVCAVELPTTGVELHMAVELVADEQGLDAIVSDPTFDLSPIGNPLSGCTLSSAMGTLLGQDPAAISGLIAGLVEPTLADLAPTVEEALEGALGSLALDTDLALGGSTLALHLEPTRVELAEPGMVVGLGGSVGLDHPSDCVPWEAGLALYQAGWPPLGETAAGSSLAYDAGLLLGADFVDSALFAVWASGLLCQDVSDLGGAALTSGVLASFLGDRYAQTFGEGAPARVIATPRDPLRARFEHDQPPLHVDLTGLDLQVITELDGRQVQVAAVEVSADIGVGVALDGGALTTALLMTPDRFRFEELGSEYLDPGYGEGLGGLVLSLLGSLLPADLLPSFQLPYLLGAEVGGLWWIPTEDGAWQGAYALIDSSAVQPVAVPGCDAQALGCDGSGGGVEFDLNTALGCGESAGCGGEGSSCSTVAVVPVGRLLLALGALAGAAARRRRR